MESKLANLEHEKEQQPYETPQVTKHGSFEQLTGLDAPVALSGLQTDET